MNYLEQFKYSKDDPIEFGVDLNTNNNKKTSRTKILFIFKIKKKTAKAIIEPDKRLIITSFCFSNK